MIHQKNYLSQTTKNHDGPLVVQDDQHIFLFASFSPLHLLIDFMFCFHNPNDVNFIFNPQEIKHVGFRVHISKIGNFY